MSIVLPKNAKRITEKQLAKLRKDKFKPKIIKDYDAVNVFKPLTDKKGNIIKEVVGQTKQGNDIIKTVIILDRQAMSKRENLLQCERIEQREKKDNIIYKKVDKINPNSGKVSQMVMAIKQKDVNSPDYIPPQIDATLNLNATDKTMKITERKQFKGYNYVKGKDKKFHKTPTYKKSWTINIIDGLKDATEGINHLDNSKPKTILRKKETL